jgi:hypothetical protein
MAQENVVQLIPVEGEQEKLIAEITFLAMMVQSKTDYCVFVDFSGHVNQIVIDIRESKQNYQERICRAQTYLNREYSIKRLHEIKDQLVEILETNKVDVSHMNYQIEEVYHYYF